MKIAVITCYHDPDYIRARTLRAALRLIPGVKLVIIKNHHQGILRYPEIIKKLVAVKKQQNPDVYLLTFRGQEILPLVLWIAGSKPVIFDELIIPIAYASNEKHTASLRTSLFHALARLSEPLYRRWLGRCAAVLADTAVHAELSARTSNMNLSKYSVVPVGCDEKIFQPAAVRSVDKPQFQVFYYSKGMQPLHGIGYVLQAAEQLQADATVSFVIVGGKKPLQKAVAASRKRGATIQYHRWLSLDELAEVTSNADLCLGGPFGNTVQAKHVITTKTYQMLASAKPVVVGASEASDEFFVDKQNALIVPQSDSDALAKVIRWAQKHPEELKTIAENGRKLYEKEFSNKAIAKTLEQLVSSL